MTPRNSRLGTPSHARPSRPAPAAWPARPVTDDWDWQLRGACRELDSALFFHPERERGVDKEARERRAKQICESCPVIENCRRWALTAREPYGVWGGLSVADRAAILKGDTHSDAAS